MLMSLPVRERVLGKSVNPTSESTNSQSYPIQNEPMAAVSEIHSPCGSQIARRLNPAAADGHPQCHDQRKRLAGSKRLVGYREA